MFDLYNRALQNTQQRRLQNILHTSRDCDSLIAEWNEQQEMAESKALISQFQLQAFEHQAKDCLSSTLGTIQ